MATSSVLKNIDVCEKHFCIQLVNALENSEWKTAKDVVVSKRVKEIKKEQILKIFGA